MQALEAKITSAIERARGLKEEKAYLEKRIRELEQLVRAKMATSTKVA